MSARPVVCPCTLPSASNRTVPRTGKSYDVDIGTVPTTRPCVPWVHHRVMTTTMVAPPPTPQQEQQGEQQHHHRRRRRRTPFRYRIAKDRRASAPGRIRVTRRRWSVGYGEHANAYLFSPSAISDREDRQRLQLSSTRRRHRRPTTATTKTIPQ